VVPAALLIDWFLFFPWFNSACCAVGGVQKKAYMKVSKIAN
jgi:hypothetical protein